MAHRHGPAECARTHRACPLLRRPEAGAFFAALLVYLFFAIAAWKASFVSFNGAAAWLDTSAELGIMALAIGMLMIAGEFDLSIGSVIGAVIALLIYRKVGGRRSLRT